MRDLDTVVLKEDLPEHGLRAGDTGTIVFVHQEGAGYEAEFVTLDSQTIAVVTLEAERVRPVAPREIAHARPVASRP